MLIGVSEDNKKNPGTLRTWRGKQIRLRDPDPANFDILDIALGLSKECRYIGRCRGFYSVAEHACHCFDVGRIIGLGGAQLRRVLLHDASEAYLRDLPSPTKLVLPDYAKIEAIVQEAIYERFMCPAEVLSSGTLKTIDLIVLKAEHGMVRSNVGDWNLQTVPTVKIAIGRWPPRRARWEFIRRYRRTCQHVGFTHSFARCCTWARVNPPVDHVNGLQFIWQRGVEHEEVLNFE